LDDKQFQCIDCGEEFYWTEGEQEFYREHGLSQPKRCRSCREQRREEKASHAAGD